MTFPLFLKTSMIWFIIALLAIINGIFREAILVGMIGPNMAMPISGITLSLIILIITYLSFPLFGKHHALTYFFIGIQWVVMTLLFEFIFGHYVMGKSWPDILEVFHIVRGNFFIIVLAVSLFSPLLMAKVKRIL